MTTSQTDRVGAIQCSTTKFKHRIPILLLTTLLVYTNGAMMNSSHTHTHTQLRNKHNLLPPQNSKMLQNNSTRPQPTISLQTSSTLTLNPLFTGCPKLVPFKNHIGCNTANSPSSLPLLQSDFTFSVTIKPSNRIPPLKFTSP